MPKVTQPPSGQRGAGIQGQPALGSRVTLSKSLPSSVKIKSLNPACLPPKAMGEALWVNLRAEQSSDILNI